MACSSMPCPAPACPSATRDVAMIAARPAAKPAMAKVAVFTRSVRMPESTAATSLPPTAKTRRPKVVRFSTKVRIAAKATRIHMAMNTPPTLSRPSHVKVSRRTEIRRPSEMTMATPLKIRLVAMVARKECTRSALMTTPFMVPRMRPMKGAKKRPR